MVNDKALTTRRTLTDCADATLLTKQLMILKQCDPVFAEHLAIPITVRMRVMKTQNDSVATTFAYTRTAVIVCARDIEFALSLHSLAIRAIFQTGHRAQAANNLLFSCETWHQMYVSAARSSHRLS